MGLPHQSHERATAQVGDAPLEGQLTGGWVPLVRAGWVLTTSRLGGGGSTLKVLTAEGAQRPTLQQTLRIIHSVPNPLRCLPRGVNGIHLQSAGKKEP